MFGNRVLRIIRKGETNVPLDKIGHIYENTFGKDAKTYTNDKYVTSPVLSKKKLGLTVFLVQNQLFSMAES